MNRYLLVIIFFSFNINAFCQITEKIRIEKKVFNNDFYYINYGMFKNRKLKLSLKADNQNKYPILKAILEQEVGNSDKIDSIRDYCSFVHRVSFLKRDTIYSYIRYSSYKNSNIVKKDEIVLLINNKLKSKLTKIEPYYTLAKEVSPLIFWQFYNKKDDKNYPEINRLKPLVKNREKVLDIEKVIQVIKENKAVLKEYLL